MSSAKKSILVLPWANPLLRTSEGCFTLAKLLVPICVRCRCPVRDKAVGSGQVSKGSRAAVWPQHVGRRHSKEREKDNETLKVFC